MGVCVRVRTFVRVCAWGRKLEWERNNLCVHGMGMSPPAGQVRVPALT